MRRAAALLLASAAAPALSGCIIAAAALQPSAASDVVLAERAFALQAQREGQWTAFRATAAADATMFVPQPVRAQDFLAGREDPPRSVAWQPARVWIACDGRTAVTYGHWQQPGGTRGYFTTVWQRQRNGGWRWLLDRGDELPAGSADLEREPPRVEEIKAHCRQDSRRPAPPPLAHAPADRTGGGRSADGTLRWQWVVTPGGALDFAVDLAARDGYQRVIADHVAGAAAAGGPS